MRDAEELAFHFGRPFAMNRSKSIAKRLQIFGGVDSAARLRRSRRRRQRLAKTVSGQGLDSATSHGGAELAFR